MFLGSKQSVCLFSSPDDAVTAETAASLVKVTYREVKPPLLDLRMAVQQKSFFIGAAPKPLIVGNPDGQNGYSLPFLKL